MLHMFLSYARLMRLDKPIGTLLLLWPTLWALLLTQTPQLSVIFIFILGVILMRSAGCVINDLADHRFDGFVERTRERPLVTGSISRRSAYLLFVILVMASAGLLFFLPIAASYFAIFALLTAMIYPLMKRLTHWPQFVLGIAFSWSIPMAYASTSGHYPLTCWLLFGSNIVWTIAYDTMYAMVDREDDRQIGVKSTAILFGRFDTLIIGILQSIAVMIWWIIGIINQLHLIYFICLGLVILLFVYQQTQIATRQRAHCFRAFLNNNYVGCLLFIGLSTHYLLN